MKVVAVNGSPRKQWNTAQVLESALEGCRQAGAETRMIHLYDIDYKGCRACFACKRLDSPTYGRCGYEDGLSPVLEELLEADLILLGTPIYFSDVSGQMRSLLERILFPGMAYDKKYSALYRKRIPTKLIFTMNMAHEGYYQPMIDQVKQVVGMVLGPVEVLQVLDTCQFDDYSKYMTEAFDAEAKASRRQTALPLDCQRAKEMGERAVKECMASQP